MAQESRNNPVYAGLEEISRKQTVEVDEENNSQKPKNIYRKLLSIVDRVFFNKSEIIKKEQSRNIYNQTDILNIAFSNLNHLTIEQDPELENGFSIEVTEDDQENFPRSVFYVNSDDEIKKKGKAKELQVFSIKVKIGKSFNVLTDLPKLSREVAKIHNEKIAYYGEEHQMMFIDTNKKLKEYWAFISNKLLEFTKENKDELEEIDKLANEPDKKLNKLLANILKKLNKSSQNKINLQQTLEEYSEALSIISKSFDDEDSTQNEEGQAKNDGNADKLNQEEKKQTAQDIDYTHLFEHEWEKTKKNLEYLIKKVIEKKDKTESSDSRYKFKQRDRLNTLIKRAVSRISLESQTKIIDEMNTQSREAFFQHAKAELFRKVGLGDLGVRLDDIESDPDLNDTSDIIRKIYDVSKENPIIKYFKNSFPKESRGLEELKEKITSETSIERKSNLQLGLANKIILLIYSEKFFLIEKGNYSFSNVIEKNYVNCMVISELINQFWGYYDGEDSLASLSKKHIFSVVRLADGKLFSLDEELSQMTDNEDNIYEIGDHSTLYQAALLNSKGNEFKKKGKYKLAERFYREAIKLSSNNPSFKYSYASLLAKDPERYEEAELLYKQSIKLAPNDPWYKTGIANFYFKERKYKLAKVYYQQSLKTMEDFPDNSNFMTKERIKNFLSYIDIKID
jgi:tetratricopeptide (TPR) repeat protein